VNNTAADLTVHARTASIHPPISAVHPTFDKPFTCGNAAIWTGAGGRCGLSRPAAVQAAEWPNLAVVAIAGTGFRHKHFRDTARCGLPFGQWEDVKRLNGCERECATPKRLLVDAETANGVSSTG